MLVDKWKINCKVLDSTPVLFIESHVIYIGPISCYTLLQIWSSGLATYGTFRGDRREDHGIYPWNQVIPFLVKLKELTLFLNGTLVW